jgi:uncharacterized lipoprotein
MAKNVFAVLAASLLAACSQTWNHPTANQADFARDDYACQRDAYAGGGAVMAYGVISPTPNRRLYEACMQSKGYTKER